MNRKSDDPVTRLVYSTLSLIAVVAVSVLLHRKYGLPEAAAFFVVAGFLLDIRVAVKEQS